VSGRFLMDRKPIPFGGTVGTPTFEGFDADENDRYYNFLIADTHIFRRPSQMKLGSLTTGSISSFR
jgi:hypothetical protein